MARTLFAPRSALRLGAMIALIPLAGCYTFAPAPMGSIEAGQTARVTLDDDGFGRVINQAATAGFPVQMMNVANNRISGQVETVDSDAMWVRLRGVGGSIFSARVATQSVEQVALRSFSPTRTLFAVGGGFLIAGALIQGGFLGGSTGGDTDIDQEFAVPMPLFSITVP